MMHCEEIARQHPFWWNNGRRGRMSMIGMTFFSRRARQYKLNQVLKWSTPDADDDDDDDEESKRRRLRRALFLLLRSMPSNDNDNEKKSKKNNSGISKMYKMAQRDAKRSNIITSTKDLWKRTPANLETPIYDVLESNKALGFQIRRYQPFSVCSVTLSDLKNKQSKSDQESIQQLSNPQLSGASSFGALAGYLFGKNQQQTSMKMTTPVFTTTTTTKSDHDDKTMSFVLPSNYWQTNATTNTAPQPLPDSVVKLSSVDTSSERAVLAFGGFGRTNDVTKQSKRLLQLLDSNPNWQPIIPTNNNNNNNNQ